MVTLSWLHDMDFTTVQTVSSTLHTMSKEVGVGVGGGVDGRTPNFYKIQKYVSIMFHYVLQANGQIHKVHREKTV